MSNNKMLIDATHPEETRVVVLRSGRVEEFDYESAARKLLRGNIYLAKVTRVEPSLQAAFVEYGGNRHGFLAFNEIHPDYYQIPMADRQALLDEEAAAEAREEAEVEAHAERLARRQRGRGNRNDRQRSRGGSGEGRSSAPRGSEAGESHPDDQPEVRDDDNIAHEEGDETPRTLAERVSASGDVLSEDLPEKADADDAGHDAVAEDAAHHDDEDASDEEASDEADDEARDAGEDDDDASDDNDGEEAHASGADVSEGAEDASDEGEGDADGESNIEVVAPPAKGAEAEVETVVQVGAEDALEELSGRSRRRPRSYKIQEVIKRRQVILVQVVKEERGNKGAALTTYLSLAGRYTVLMPNTARGGGISRKITQPQDRKRLKAIAQELEVPEGMGLIIRTAGAARTKQEIKRDFEYLLRLWESVRDLTLQSTAPNLVYEEGNLIKRSIRDLYNKDVDEIVVAGDEAHHEARDFMRMLMPSHTKNVLLHGEPEPLFTRFGIERQLNAMFSPYVTLRSGGYLVINQTEALVAIDVNSGKSTREFSIEETALNTNLEASDEIARQLKLRDLAGLVVIDFIDMEEKRNNRAVERRLKDALRFDRARIQLGRISHFGLMEMSRQRMRTGVLEGSTSQCPHCQGTGIIRSTESVALAVIRGLEDTLMAGSRTSLIATTTATVALYLLNNKRPYINEMEARHGLTITIQASDKLQGANFTIEKGQSAATVQASRRPPRSTAVNMDWGFEGEEEAEDEVMEGEDARPSAVNGRDHSEVRSEDGEGREGGDGRRRRRRRRGRRGDRDGDNGGRTEHVSRDRASEDDEADSDQDGAVEPSDNGDEGADDSSQAAAGNTDQEGAAQREGRRRRRGRRGGRRGRDRGDRGEVRAANDDGQEPAAGVDDGDDDFDSRPADHGHEPGEHASNDDVASDETPAVAASEGEVPDSPRVADVAPARVTAADAAASEPEVETRIATEKVDEPVSEPSRPRRSISSSEPKLERVVVRPDEVEAEGASAEVEVAAPARRGWWQKR